MALTGFAANNYLLRTSNTLNYNAAYTQMGWFYVTNSSNSGSLFSVFGQELNFDKSGYGGGTFDIAISYFANNSQAFSLASPSFSFQNTWLWFAFVRLDASNVQCYANGDTIASPATFSTANRTALSTGTCLGAGVVGQPAQPLTGKAFNCFEYDAALTQEEVRQQMFKHLPQRTSNLKAWIPMFSDGATEKDFSGNNFDYSIIGTLTDTDSLLIPVSPLFSKGKSGLIYRRSPLMLSAC